MNCWKWSSLVALAVHLYMSLHRRTRRITAIARVSSFLWDLNGAALSGPSESDSASSSESSSGSSDSGSGSESEESEEASESEEEEEEEEEKDKKKKKKETKKPARESER